MSIYAIKEGKEKDAILEILEHTYSYLEIEKRILEENPAIIDVIILNQHQNICFFLIYPNRTVIVSPYIPINTNKTLFICSINKELEEYNSNVCCIADAKIIDNIINAPKVCLINYCDNDKFTIPRLNLSTHMLASFIRANSLSRVYIIDMQFSLNNQDVINQIELLKPDVIGLSVNYGLFEKSIDFLDALYEAARKSQLNIHVLLGNIIPAVNYMYYIERYHDIAVSYAEGEEAIKDYIDYVNAKKDVKEVSGIYYYDESQKIIVKNKLKQVELDELPFPALDTLLDIKMRKGTLSLEFSRGCSHSACTFCPRDHKGKTWRYMSPMHMYELSEKLYAVCKKEHMGTRIYIADEEFVGYINGYDENKRIVKYFSLLQQNKITLTIDVSCRVDSVYAPDRGELFNLDKMNMWMFCQKNGLGRVFLGVESFSDSQLIRYNKSTTCAQNIVAIKILSALGIDIRLGILLFDQLMTSILEIKENVRILGRTDIIQENIKDDIDCDKLYSDIIHGKSNSANVPLYMKTSYLLTVMEVLKNSSYLKLCENKRLELAENKNWGKYDVPFINRHIGIMSKYLSKWVGINYPIVYALKTLLKSARADEYQMFNRALESYKTINYKLLQYSIKYIDDSGLIKGHILSFSEFLSLSFVEHLTCSVDDIDDFWEKAIYDAKRIFEGKLDTLRREICSNSDTAIKQKMFQLIDHYQSYEI